MNTQNKAHTLHVLEQILYDADAEPRTYCAFPSILKTCDTEILIAYKHGFDHMMDDSALELIRFHPGTKQVKSREVLEDTPGENCQDPEIMRMPNGDLMIYLDVQQAFTRPKRLGIKIFRSSDNGKTWKSEAGTLQDDTGIVYGYVFDDVVLGEDIYLLAMTFPELENKGCGRSVHVLHSRDNGHHWHHLKNLTEVFGYPFNESTFLPIQDGFLVVTRGDKQGEARISKAFSVDRDWNVRNSCNLTEQTTCIHFLGRPKLFCEDGAYYLLTRNVPPSGGADLMLYQINAETLLPEGHVCLQHLDKELQDSFYAESYWTEEQGEKQLQVITYSDKFSKGPDIVRLEFSWAEILALLAET